MDVPNIDNIFYLITEFVDKFASVNPKTTAFLTFLVGWIMKRSPTVERIMKWVLKNFGRS